MRYLISGGGTGGHINPAIAIADELKRRTGGAAEVLFVGSQGKMEMDKVPRAGYTIEGVALDRGFSRSNMAANIPLLWKLPLGLWQSRQIIKRFRPDVAIGVGGYASLAALKAAQWMGVPTVLQEQNSFAGMVNKQLAGKAAKICVAYEGMERFFPADRIVITGNPVRQSLVDCTATVEQAREQLGLRPDLDTILIIGGSQGARTVNRAIIDGLERLARQADVQVLWQTGKNYLHAEALAAMESVKPGNVVRTDFIDRMDLAYRAATIVVSRAGASSIGELQLLGKAAILVPATFVTEDHQRHNAQALVDRDAAMMVMDDDVTHNPTGEALAHDVLVDRMLTLVHDRARIASLQTNISQMALDLQLGNAASKIVDEILGIRR